MNAADRTELFTRFARLNPNPTTELEYRTPFELMVAVLLSAQATDVSVNLATRGLFRDATTPEAMLALGLPGIITHIQRIGLFRNKAKHLLETCRLLVERHGGNVPADRDALESLPGVGRKTANVILNTAFGQPTIAVDTHIFRVSNRMGLARGKTVDEVERKLLRAVPKPFLHDAHHWLILHGRYLCKARRPECWRCPVIDLCAYRDKPASPADRPIAKRTH